MIKVEPMEPLDTENYAVPLNPFHQDIYSMGTTLGTNVTVMYGNHTHTHQPYIIVVNLDTGERIKIAF